MTKALNPYMAMIFANTKGRVDDIHHFLTSNGLKVAKIHGDVPPRERKRIMNSIKILIINMLLRLILQRVELILKEFHILSMMKFQKT